MKRTILAGLIASFASVGGGALAASEKETDCAYQGQVVAAVQQARLDRVKEEEVRAHVSAEADWPDRYNNAIPIFAGWIYGGDVKMKDLREQNLGEAWRQTCLSQ